MLTRPIEVRSSSNYNRKSAQENSTHAMSRRDAHTPRKAMRKAFLPCNPLNVDFVLHGAPPGKLEAAELS
jgi:hypothetical protein